MTITSFSGENAFLSNFFYHNGTTVEHWFQARKKAGSPSVHILRAASPGIAKRMGRDVQLRADWHDIRDIVMYQELQYKFYPVSILGPRLIATGDQVLIEGNRWHDNYWGDCSCGRPACIKPGLNILGNLLMQIRTEIS